MNKERRKAIEKISDKLTDLQAEIEELREAEEEAYDNLPESLQDGERGDAMQEAMDNMECAGSSIQDAIDYLGELL